MKNCLRQPAQSQYVCIAPQSLYSNMDQICAVCHHWRTQRTLCKDKLHKYTGNNSDVHTSMISALS